MARSTATLPLTLGGLGLRRSERSRVVAHWASWPDTLPMIQERHPAVAELIIGSLQEGPLEWTALAGGLRPEPREPELHEPGCQSGLAARSSQPGRAPLSGCMHLATPHSHTPRHVEVPERPSCWHPVLSGTVVFLDQVGTGPLQGSPPAAPLLASVPVQTQLPVWPSPRRLASQHSHLVTHAVVVTISDARFCQEQEQVDGITQNFKSQQACIKALALGNELNAEKMLVHPLSWSSTRIRTVCRSTLMAEACAPSNAVERGLRTRAIIVDMRGQLNIRQWEETASAAVGHVWFTDCESLFSHLISPNTKQVDNKRLALDLSALKQLIWDNRDDCEENVDESKGDDPRWIDTSAMLADCLTKTKNSCRLNETLSTGIFDMKPTVGSLAVKAKNRQWSVSKKEQKRPQDPHN